MFALAGVVLTSTATQVGVLPYGAMFIAIVALGIALHGRLRVRLAPVDQGLGLISLFIAAYWVQDPPETAAGIVSGYALILFPVALLVLRVVASETRADWRVGGWFGAGAVVSVGIGLINAYVQVLSGYADYETARVFESSIGSSNAAAARSAIVGVLLAGYAVRLTGLARYCAWTLSIVFLSAPIVFASRGGALAVVIGLLAIGLQARRGRGFGRIGRALAVSIVFVAVAVLAQAQGWLLWRRLATDSAASGSGFSSGRVDLWRSTMEVILEHPILGVGPGQLSDSLMAIYRIAYSHNLVLDVVAQLGIVAGIIVLWHMMPRALGATPVLPAIIAALVSSMVEPNITTPVGALMYAGLLASHAAASRREARVDEPVKARGAEEIR